MRFVYYCLELKSEQEELGSIDKNDTEKQETHFLESCLSEKFQISLGVLFALFLIRIIIFLLSIKNSTETDNIESKTQNVDHNKGLEFPSLLPDQGEEIVKILKQNSSYSSKIKVEQENEEKGELLFNAQEKEVLKMFDLLVGQDKKKLTIISFQKNNEKDEKKFILRNLYEILKTNQNNLETTQEDKFFLEFIELQYKEENDESIKKTLLEIVTEEQQSETYFIFPDKEFLKNQNLMAIEKLETKYVYSNEVLKKKNKDDSIKKNLFYLNAMKASLGYPLYLQLIKKTDDTKKRK